MKRLCRLSIHQVYILLLIYTLAFWFSKELARPTISIALADASEYSALAGVLLSVQNFFPLILAIPLATLGDKFGQEKILSLGSCFTIVSGVCFLLSLLTNSIRLLILITIGQILSGIAWTVSWISLQALVSDCDEENKRKGLPANGINRLILIMSLGMVLGPIIAGYLIDDWGTGSVWALNLVLCIIQIAISFLIRTSGSLHRKTEREETREIVKPTQRGMILSELGGRIYLIMIMFSFIMMFGSELRGSYFSVILRTASMPTKIIGYVSSSGALATCIIRIIMNLPLFEKAGRKQIIIISMVFCEAAFVVLSIIRVGYGYFVPSIFIGLCGGMVEPVLIMYILEHVQKERKGLALTGRVLANRLAMFLSPMVASLLVNACGINFGFGILAVIMAAFIILTLLGMKMWIKEEK